LSSESESIIIRSKMFCFRLFN